MKTKGTPGTLRDAVVLTLTTTNSKEFPELATAIVKDYLAQKFGVAYLKASESELRILSDLWKDITGEVKR